MEVQQNQPLPEENCTRFLIVAFVKRPGELKIKESKFDKKYQVGSLGYLIRFTVSMVGIVDQRWCVTLYIKYLYTIVQNPNLPHQVVQVNHQKECGGQFGSRYCEIIIWYIYSDISMHEISIPIILNYIHITLYHSLNPLSIPFVQPLTVGVFVWKLHQSPNKKNSRTQRSVRSFVPCIKGNRNEAVKVEVCDMFRNGWRKGEGSDTLPE